jgi:hypothetical protein
MDEVHVKFEYLEVTKGSVITIKKMKKMEEDFDEMFIGKDKNDEMSVEDDDDPSDISSLGEDFTEEEKELIKASNNWDGVTGNNEHDDSDSDNMDEIDEFDYWTSDNDFEE